MKRIIAILLLLAMALSLAACNSGDTGYGDHFVHKTPEDKAQQTKHLLERNDFAEYMETIMNIEAYPDILILDNEGLEVVGMYIYDSTTGYASGWTDLTTGQKHFYEAGKELFLGLPDTEKLVYLQGSVKLGIAVYEQDGKATGAELYFFLSKAADSNLLQGFMLDYYGEVLEQESETVYKLLKDETAIQKDFTTEEEAGLSFYDKNLEDYLSVLIRNYGVIRIIE
jgi:hypothetical protein